MDDEALLAELETERQQRMELQADSHRYKQIGNAVTVNVIEWIGNRL